MKNNQTKVLFVANNFDIVIYRFRKEVVQAFVDKGYNVALVVPYSVMAEEFCNDNNITFIPIDIDRRGKNPFKDIQLLFKYFKIIKKEGPTYIFSYTIKPNIYIGLANRFFKKKFFPNVTGLGSVFAKQGVAQGIISTLYKFSFKRVSSVFFQNEQNKQLFINRKIVSKDRSVLLPGSGVNLKENHYIEYPKNDKVIRFVFLGRIMKEKGIYELVKVFSILEKEYNNISLDVYGFCEGDTDDFLNLIKGLESVKYHGFTTESKRIVAESYAIVQPSYEGYEGLSNSLLEAAAIGRPVITTDACGCREVVENGVSGYLAEQQNVDSLRDSIEKFINLPYTEKMTMGIKSHERVREKFNRDIVVRKYIGVAS